MMKRKRDSIKFLTIINRAVKDRNYKVLVLLFTVPLAVAAVIVCLILKNRGTPVESESEGDIFSRGFDERYEMSVIAEDIPKELLNSINKETVSDGSMLAIYENMKRDNPDLAGYLRINGTKIEYPVMYTPYEPEKYLNRDINEKKSSGGLPFIDARCSLEPESDNLIIYGHNMKNGSMFGTLTNYEDIDYYREHPVIEFDTVEEERQYEVMSAFYDRIYYKDEKDFRFYDFIDTGDADEFDNIMKEFRNRSIYDTGVKADYGDKFITLVTCSYQEENGRFVVIAKRSGITDKY